MLIQNLSFQVSWFGIEKFSSLTVSGNVISLVMDYFDIILCVITDELKSLG